MKTVKEIVTEYLKANNFDGLVHVDSECGCGIGNLFITEHCPDAECQTAHKVKCKKCDTDLYSTGTDDCDECIVCCD